MVPFSQVKAGALVGILSSSPFHSHPSAQTLDIRMHINFVEAFIGHFPTLQLQGVPPIPPTRLSIDPEQMPQE